MRDARLLGCLMKATATVNYNHGPAPFHSGKRRIGFRQAAEHLMAVANEDFMHELTEKGWHAGGKALTKDEFLGHTPTSI